MKPVSEKNAIFQITKISKESYLNNSQLKSLVFQSGEFYYDGIIDLFIKSSNSQTVSAFHSNFFKFKQALCFKRIHRKSKIDSILKKCKSKFVRIIQEATKEILSDISPQPKFPQNFITNINIDANKKDLNLTLRELYEIQDREFDYNATFSKLSADRQEVFHKFLSKSYKDLFTEYIKSLRFIEDCKVINQKEGEKFEILYRYVSKIYISYYSISKGNKTKNHDYNSGSHTSLSTRRFCVTKK